LKRFPGTKDIKLIDNIEGTQVLKCYFRQKNIRSIIFLRGQNNIFIPISLVKKGTRKGKNIMKENYKILFKGEITRINQELETDNYRIEKL